MGPTVVIDVFRAFSAAAYALAAGAEEIVLTETVAEAESVAHGMPGSVLMGEVNGVKPPGFHLGNSPGEIVASGERARREDARASQLVGYPVRPGCAP